MKKLLVMVLICSLIGIGSAWAEEPMDTMKVNIDKVLSILKNPAYQAESQMTLGKSWSELSSAQQQEFIDLFKEILEKAYIDKILAYKDETIEYVKNQALSETKAEVETRIVSGGTPVTLTYRLVNMNGRWGVYDVIVEGVSLAKNYRTQFRDILAKKSPAELIDTLRKKVG
jgi:phospholipid transport system substrate-binding protein